MLRPKQTKLEQTKYMLEPIYNLSVGELNIFVGPNKQNLNELASNCFLWPYPLSRPFSKTRPNCKQQKKHLEKKIQIRCRTVTLLSKIMREKIDRKSTVRGGEMT